MTMERTAARKRARRPDEARRARDCARWKEAYGDSVRKRRALLGTIGRPFV
jgi:hypothetical protein